MTTAIVIPCYNEALRLPVEEIKKLVAAGLNLLLVDDGSTDYTLKMLQDLQAEMPDRIVVVSSPDNVGKGEAVRRGLLQAIDHGHARVGYLDADFATSADEMLRLLTVFEQKNKKVLMGSRWLRLGSNVQRQAWRHYPGRVFATLASRTLQMPVYDTQCGAKLFDVSAGLSASLASPFISRWAFDVELIGRLKANGYGNSDFYEEPLDEWIDKGGSKMTFQDVAAILWDLFRIRMRR